MLVVTSNWALGDGTIVPVDHRPHSWLPTAIHRAAIRAGFRRDGTYRPVERLDVVFAGDTFDSLLSSAWWGAARPWHESCESRELLAGIAGRCLRRARRSLGPLVRWGRHGLRVPSAARGRPGRETVDVPVCVTLLVGDRDAMVAGLEPRRRSLPLTVGHRWDDGRITIRHGHELDPVCGTDEPAPWGCRDRRPTLGESVSIDLVGRFLRALMVDGQQARAVVGPLARRLAVAGPMTLPHAFHGWGGLSSSRGERDGLYEAVVTAWRRSVEAWRHEARRCVPSCEVECDVIDALGGWLDRAMDESDRAPTVPDALQCLLPRSSRQSAGAVVGHLVPSDDTTGAMLLGVPPVGSLAPKVVICPEDGGWPRWEPLSGEDESPSVIAIHGAKGVPVETLGGVIIEAA